MKFGRLLRLLRDGILHDKSDQPTGSDLSDYLWDDETLTDYINEAQRRFAVGSLCIRDYQTPDVCEFQLVAHQKEYQLHSSIFAVISARLGGARMDLARAGHSQFDTYNTLGTPFFNTDSLQQFPPGDPVAYDTDEGLTADDWGSMGVINLRVYPVPLPQYVRKVKLRVCRRPMREFDLRNLEAVPEIPVDHHIDMLDWAAYLALRIVDRDAGDAEHAEQFRAAFEVHVKEARLIAMRKMFTPMQWGFGRNGFSYERDGNGG